MSLWQGKRNSQRKMPNVIILTCVSFTRAVSAENTNSKDIRSSVLNCRGCYALVEF